jgi:phage tail-like protein
MAMDTHDGAPAYAFIARIDGLAVPQVTEVSGIALEVDAISLNQQTSEGKFVAMQTMGRPKTGTFMLTRAFTKNKAMLDWMKTVGQGDLKGARKTAAVELLDHQGEVVLTYNFENCWVKKIEVSTLKAGGTENITEKTTISYDRATVT